MFGKLEVNSHSNKMGVGLGLTISKALSLELGGDITVESEYGKGSKFAVIIKDETEKTTQFV